MSSVSIHVSPTAHTEIEFSDAFLAHHTGGVGLSGPVLKQFASLDEEMNFWGSIVKPGGFESHGNLTMSKDVGFL